MHRFTAVCILALATVLPACDGDDASSTTVVFVDQARYGNHLVDTRVDARDPSGVTRVELYLDDMRVAALELAPFATTWDASGFAEGEHELRALAYTSDGRTASVAQPFDIDRTPPTLSVPDEVLNGEPFPVHADDSASGVVEVRARVDGADIGVLTAPPYNFVWPDSACGAVPLEVVATDAVGNRTEVTAMLGNPDPFDADCDGTTTDLDCDDRDPRAYPSALDSGFSIADLDCDGVPGADTDDDHVPSVATGGSDCGDDVTQVHGAWPGWVGRHLYTDVPHPRRLSSFFSPAEVLTVAIVGNDGRLHVGSLIVPVFGNLPELHTEVVAEHVDLDEDRAPILASGDAVVYFQDGALVASTRTAAGKPWTHEVIDSGSDLAPLSHATARFDRGVLYVAYQVKVGSSSGLRVATQIIGGWQIGEPSGFGVDPAQMPAIARDDAGRIHVMYAGSSRLNDATFDGKTWVNATASTLPVQAFAVYHFPTDSVDELVAITFGSIMYGFPGDTLTNSGILLSPEQPLASMTSHRGALFLGLTDGRVLAADWLLGPVTFQELYVNEVAGSVEDDVAPVVRNGDDLWLARGAYVEERFDASIDGTDQDCDGSDGF